MHCTWIYPSNSFVDIGYLLTNVFGLALDTVSTNILLKLNLISIRNKVRSCQWLLTGVQFLSSMSLDISHTHTSPLPLLKWTSGSTYWRQAGEVW
jgi:hypothetical protein